MRACRMRVVGQSVAFVARARSRSARSRASRPRPAAVAHRCAGVIATVAHPLLPSSRSASGHGAVAYGIVQRRRHRRANRLAIERVGAVGLQEHAVHAERRSVAEDRRPRCPRCRRARGRRVASSRSAHHLAPITRGRSHADGQAAAMKVETRHAVHHRLRHDVDRERLVGQSTREAMPAPVSVTSSARVSSPLARSLATTSRPSATKSPRRASSCGSGTLRNSDSRSSSGRFDADGAHAGIVPRSAVVLPLRATVSTWTGRREAAGGDLGRNASAV